MQRSTPVQAHLLAMMSDFRPPPMFQKKAVRKILYRINALRLSRRRHLLKTLFVKIFINKPSSVTSRIMIHYFEFISNYTSMWCDIGRNDFVPASLSSQSLSMVSMQVSFTTQRDSSKMIPILL